MGRVVALGIAVLVCAIVVWIFKQLFEHVRVWEWEKGLKYFQGRFTGVVDPGRYWICTYNSSITCIDMRPRIVVTTGQEVLSADNIALKISVAIRYRVIDPVRAVHSQQHYEQAAYLLVQIAIREAVGGYPIDDLLEKRFEVDGILMARTGKQFDELGLELISVNIRDITFPGDLKKVFALAVKARKEGQAALERARGETAALRNLANAARLMEDNPKLLQLRTIQALSESSGNTLVLSMAGAQGVLPVKAPDYRGAKQREAVHED
jgi:regulator of protease activity HflC (stomatin/prohibitin superfamily)